MLEFEEFEELEEFSEFDDFEEFDDEGELYCELCNNLGTIDCECGGDICVCENNGEITCPECGFDR